MYIAMNRFKVVHGKEADFEAVWANRDSRLDEMPGFGDFRLVRGPEREDHTLYASHTTWASQEAFSDWTRSEQFRAAHKGAGANRALYLEPPQFEGFTVVLGG